MHVYTGSAATTGDDNVQVVTSPVEKPEPEKVIVVPTGPELELMATNGPFTVNCADVDGDPDWSTKVMKYVPAATFATTKLPLIVPSLS